MQLKMFHKCSVFSRQNVRDLHRSEFLFQLNVSQPDLLKSARLELRYPEIQPKDNVKFDNIKLDHIKKKQVLPLCDQISLKIIYIRQVSFSLKSYLFRDISNKLR